MPKSGEQYKKLLFLGGGNIAGAVACGIARSGAVAPESISVYDVDKTKYQKFKDCGIGICDSLRSASCDADFIFIAVKPNVVRQVVSELASFDGVLDRSVLVSFAAGVSCAHINSYAGRECKIIRTMPSTPMLVGEGVLAAYKSAPVSKRDFEYICRLISTIAHVEVVDESALNPIISVSGSSPAYVYLFIKAMLDASRKLGVDERTALPLILKTVKGSVTMIERSGSSLDELISEVASPNGTTIEAIRSFENDDLSGAVYRAMKACLDRANEISSEL